MKACVRLMMVAMLLLVLAPFAPRALAQSCTELITDGGFEAGAGWQLGLDPVPPQYVAYTKHGGNRALALGITSGANAESFSSARQLVTIPASAMQVTLSFWFYAMADSPATTDYMELVLLDATGAAIVAKPWYSHNDSRIWNQMSLDLTPWRGQTVQVYFNVYNDGLGGTAGMFLDDVSLTVCTGGPSPTPTGVLTGTPAPTATASRTPTATPGCVDLLMDGAFSGGLGSWQVADDPAGATAANSLYRSASYSLKLGSLEQNLNGLTTVRQLVTIPIGYAQVKLEAWVYTQAQAGAGADYQRVALQNSGGSLLFTPWQTQENNPAWHLLAFDVTSFAGQSVFVSFAVNNDGAGGRSVMYVDDVRLLACTAGAAATVTSTPLVTATPTSIGTPSATPTSVPSGCINLLQNGGFEAQFANWFVPANQISPQVVASPIYEGSYAVQLGSQTQNLCSYSSVRQPVVAPVERPRVYLQFWTYTWAESLSGADRQQAVILGPGDAVWFVPWKVLESSGAWQPHSLPLIGVAGQAFTVYFNVINDGMGGRTAMWVDDVRLYACTNDAMPPPLPVMTSTATPAVIVSTGTPIVIPAAGSTATGGVTPGAITSAGRSAATPAADLMTRIAPLAPIGPLTGAQATAAAPASENQPERPATSLIERIAVVLQRIQRQVFGAEKMESAQAARALLSCILIAAAIAVAAWFISRQKRA